MLNRLATAGVIASLVLSIGLHWAFIQSAAWVTMLVTYTAETGSLSQAVEDTFDGSHPCKLCKALENGQKEGQKKEAQDGKLKKLDLVFQESPKIICPERDRTSPNGQLVEKAERRDAPGIGPPRAIAA